MYYKFFTLIICLIISAQLCRAQVKTVQSDEQATLFIAYELGEAAFNKFQSLSGEIGINFPNKQSLRLTHMNVNLTEQHLSSSFAGAVDGSDVKGKLFGFELFYDFPAILDNLYLGPSLGYYNNNYEHTILNQKLRQKSVTLGVGISYQESDIFNIKGLYYRFSIPIRTHLNPSEKTNLGDSVINKNNIDNNIWLFIGYEF